VRLEAAMTLDVERVRQRFPGLRRRVGDSPAAFLDGPAGSQVPDRVIEAIGRYLAETNANSGGAFVTTLESDALMDEAHRAAADLVGSPDPDLTVFGPNMTTLTLGLARALARTWRPGDEVIVTRLDHDANITPWVQAATDAGATVHHLRFHPEDCTLDLDHLLELLGPRTRLVAVGCASNAVGTINPVAEITRLAHAAGALVFLDAVHLAPHALLDAAAWDCDFLCCSAYKFFGPHVGILYGKRAHLESLPVYKLRPPSEDLPHRWETGTQSHEGIAGVLAAIDYLADIGREGAGAGLDRRGALRAAFERIGRHERALTEAALAAFASVRGVRVFGISDPRRIDERAPTFGFTVAGLASREVAARLASAGVFVWSGHFYALSVVQDLKLAPEGLVRAGFLHYNTAAEVERLRQAIEAVA
jgi:cysteine desulfurase family protein (TIGR01976 family)